MTQVRHEAGFVYVLTNPSMPGIVKVGKTSWLSEDRAQKLFTTGVPEPFDVAFRLATSRPGDVERYAHDSLAEYRVHPRREFFRISTAEAIDAVRLAAVDAAGVASWANERTVRLTRGDRLALTLEKGQIFALLSFPALLSESAEVIDLWEAHSDGDLLEILATPLAGHVAAFSDGHPGGCDDTAPFLDRDNRVANGMINGRELLVPGDRLLWMAPPTEDHPAMHVLFEAADYCQVISRTWSPMIGWLGLPMSLNDITLPAPMPEMSDAIMEAQALPMPRHWAPRNRTEWEGWVPIATDLQPPEHWLPQLKRRQPKKRP